MSCESCHMRHGIWVMSKQYCHEGNVARVMSWESCWMMSVANGWVMSHHMSHVIWVMSCESCHMSHVTWVMSHESCPMMSLVNKYFTQRLQINECQWMQIKATASASCMFARVCACVCMCVCVYRSDSHRVTSHVMWVMSWEIQAKRDSSEAMRWLWWVGSLNF